MEFARILKGWNMNILSEREEPEDSIVPETDPKLLPVSTRFVLLAIALCSATGFIGFYGMMTTDQLGPDYPFLRWSIGIVLLGVGIIASCVTFIIAYYKWYFNWVFKNSIRHRYLVDEATISKAIRSALEREGRSFKSLNADRTLHFTYLPVEYIPLTDLISVDGSDIHIMLKMFTKPNLDVGMGIFIGPLNKKTEELITRIDHQIGLSMNKG
jgi:hypothetical protein